MAVNKVSQREIIEVPYQLPDGSIKPHMALVLSTEKLQLASFTTANCMLALVPQTTQILISCIQNLSRNSCKVHDNSCWQPHIVPVPL